MLALGFALWVVAWFWFFSFQYSSGFFRYHLDTRLPFLALSILVVIVAPLSGYWWLKQFLRYRIGGVRAVVYHALVSAAPLALFGCVHASWLSLANRTGRTAFEADEAMGIGINFIVCTNVVLLSYVLVGIAMIVVGISRHKKNQQGGST